MFECSAGENFPYVFKAARNGPHAPPGRAACTSLPLRSGQAERPAAGAKGG
jgi:hypothetical protein